ncbi:MAG: 4-hydroxythreonine-4-phosphate dehydrogenase PdxA [bacterium]
MKIGITMGDPAGIGPEITLKAINRIEKKDSGKYVIIGAKDILKSVKKNCNIKWDGEIINCVTVYPEYIKYGKISVTAGNAAYKYIIKGYDLIKEKKINALVTAPICKASIKLAGFDYPGHTELLAELSNTKRFAMMLAGTETAKNKKPLRVTLVTTHIPIKEVSSSLTKKTILEKIELTQEFLVNNFGIKQPNIGVCALNPHSDEFGEEEKNFIRPAVERAKSYGINVSGPYPADTLFTKPGFDAIVAMYHDQGLIPLKLKEFGNAVNITLGLPFVRTSPDHGTAFDIAGKWVADPGSMINAIKMAEKLAK